MNPVFRNIFLLIVFSPMLLTGQNLNYKVLNTLNTDMIGSAEIAMSGSWLNSPQSLGDLNSDGIPEVVFSQSYVDSLFIIYLNKKAEVTEIKVVDISIINNGFTDPILNNYHYKHLRVIGDLDNDGISEIAVGHPGINKGVVCILFLNKNGELKDYNIIDPYFGENPFYSDSKPADGFGYAVFPFGYAKDENSPDLIIQGFDNVLCDSIIEYIDTQNVYFDTVYYNSIRCAEQYNSLTPVVFVVTLNSDGSVYKYNTLELYNKSFYISEGDTIYTQFELMPRQVCNLGDMDGNGVDDLIINGVSSSHVVYFNEDYSVKSSGFRLFDDEFSEGVTDAPGSKNIASIPDVNMDGIPEFVFSANHEWDDGDTTVGRLYVGYLDSAGKVNKLDTVVLDSIININLNDFTIGLFGLSVSNLGDINDDGFPEVLVYSLMYDKLEEYDMTNLNPPVNKKWIRLSLNGTELTSDRHGKKGSAYHFNGENDYVTVEVSEDSYPYVAFPYIVSLWFKIDAFGDTSSVLYASEEVSDIYSGFWVDYLPNGKITAGYGDGQGNSEENRRSKVSNTIIDTSSWHNVVAVFNGLDDIELYIDCQLDSGTYSGSGNSLSVEYYPKSVMGRSLGHSAASYHNGKIDELFTFDWYLPKDQLERLCTGDSIFDSYSGAISVISIYPDSCLGSECVWPGDANFDGIVNSKDIIQIGSVFSETSDKKRTMASADWVEQTCEDWSLNKFSINAKHSDSDGNGVVNFLDASVVEKNYSKVSFKMDETVPTDPFGPPLYIMSNRDTVSNQDSIVYSISLGDSETPAENVYGVSMTLKHEVEEVFGSINSASFTGSWLGTKNVDMIATGFPLEDGIDIGMSRIDQTNLTGQGYLSTVKVIIPDNLGEVVREFDLRLTDLLIKSDNGDTIIPNIVYGDPVVLLNKEELDINLLEKGLKVYPNPSSGVFNVVSELQLDKIRVMDLSGRSLHELAMPSQHELLNLSGLEKGVYIIEFQSGNLTAYERIFVK